MVDRNKSSAFFPRFCYGVLSFNYFLGSSLKDRRVIIRCCIIDTYFIAKITPILLGDRHISIRLNKSWSQNTSLKLKKSFFLTLTFFRPAVGISVISVLTRSEAGKLKFLLLLLLFKVFECRQFLDSKKIA